MTPVGNHATFDLIILGSGYGGALAALIARQQGWSVAICDPTPHPRFVIGESSTPTTSLLLESIAEEFDLPELLPLTRYDRWLEHTPQLMRGRKRGFTYAAVEQDDTGERHVHPLLAVAASTSDETADTHWLRSDVDRYVLASAVRRGTRLIAAHPIAQRYQDDTWRLVFERSEPIRGRYLLVAGALPRGLEGLEPVDRPFGHRSAMSYTHVRPDASIAAPLSQTAGRGTPWPFDLNAAAVHRLDASGAWAWDLTFDDGRRSIGVEVPLPESIASDDRDRIDELLLARRRSLLGASTGEPIAETELAHPPGRWIDLHRPQRRLTTAGGPGFAVLPHVFGFVTPLHSTGLMSTTAAAPLAIETLREHGNGETLTHRYAALLAVVDELAQLFTASQPSVATAERVEAAVMHYVAAATAGERGALDRCKPLLLSGPEAWLEHLREANRQLREHPETFFDWSAKQLAAFSPLPLCRRESHGVYTQTAAR